MEIYQQHRLQCSSCALGNNICRTMAVMCSIIICAHADAKGIDSLAEKNRKIGELWRGLSMDEKKYYYTLAKEESTPGMGHGGDWKTVSKILGNMNANVS